MADERHYADEGLGLLEGEFTGDHNVEDPELEAIKARVREMEEEAEKLKEVQYETEKHLIMSPQASGVFYPMTAEEKVDADNRSVYVGNVDYGSTADELEVHFNGCGPVNRVTILCDKFSGHPKGFAYIEFSDRDSVKTAMALDETLFRGRIIKRTPQQIVGGIPKEEILVSEESWLHQHLGHRLQYLPLQHGFDKWFGSPNCHFGPYSSKEETPNIPVYNNSEMVSYQLGSVMDLFTTSLSLAGLQPPTDRELDGLDLTHVLLENRIIERVSSAEYQAVLKQISPAVEKHRKELVPGMPQLNMCDLAVMATKTFFTNPLLSGLHHSMAGTVLALWQKVLGDICPVLKDPEALTAVIDLFEQHVRQTYPQVELIVGLDARGFLFGPLLAQRLGVGFVLIRKKGKLPGPTQSVGYTLEYGMAEAEIQEDAIDAGQKVIIIDDLLATGGTLYAACELLKKQSAEVLGCMVLIELKDLNGAERVKPSPLFSLVQY
ncbi:Adenine phosphoribosyltransferase [Acipenser ruthenus]|uniref:Adenine phosphoribosyltransferase n=1 Tax=Acipenser ruthenus TaxID=7906 RepID=A0A662YV20_ACIRT|nr:Adenine phosphoribosyltransferase [Acipenser ruthenus]